MHSLSLEMQASRREQRQTTLKQNPIIPVASSSASGCDCPEYDCVKDRIASDLGFPNSNTTLYDGITTIINNTIVDRTALSTDDSATVVLLGDGVGSPLTAAFAPDAITSPDGSIDVTIGAGGVVELSSLISEPLFTSPDSSITIIPPTVEGESYELLSATTFSSTATVVPVVTPGGPVTPPNVALNIPSTAIQPNNTSPGTIVPVTVTYNVGTGFTLGVAVGSLPSTNVIVPNTFFVGATVPGTPNGATLEAAIAYVNGLGSQPTVANPFQIIVAPGTYGTLGSSVTLPLNTNVVAWQQGTATLQQNIIYTDTSAASNGSLLLGITLVGSVTITTSAKTGGTTRLRFQNVTHTSPPASAITLRPSTVAAPSADKITFTNGTMTSVPLTLSGGLVEFSNANISGGAWVLTASATALATKFQAKNTTFQPTTFVQNNNNFTSFLGSSLGGTWLIDGAGTFCCIQQCSATSPLPTAATGAVLWTLQPANGSQTLIKATNLYQVVTKLTAGTWSLTQPSLLTPATGGTVDRDLRFQLIGLPTLTIGTLTIALPVPLTTGFSDVVGALPYAQNPVSTLQAVSNGTGLLPSMTSTTSSIALTNQLTLLQSFAGVTVDVPTPNRALWYY